MKQHSRFARTLGVLAVLIGTAFAAPAFANSTSYSGTVGGVAVSGTGTALGNLALPASVSFTDLLSANTGTTSLMTTDDWSFMVQPAQVGTTIVGDQISLSNFSVSGVVSSIALFSGTVGTGTQLFSTTSSGSISSALLGTLTQAGSYYLEVTASLAPGSTGSYTGTLVAQPIPEPGSLALVAAGLAFVVFAARRR